MEKSPAETLEIRLKFPRQEHCNSMGFKGLLPVLQFLEGSLFPRPVKMTFAGKARNQERKQKIDSYLSPKLLAILEPTGNVGTHITIHAYNVQNQELSVFFSQSSWSYQMVIRFDIEIVDTMDSNDLKSLFLRLLEWFPDVYFAHCTFSSYCAQFNMKYMYHKSRGAAHMNYVVWLQYIGAEELAAQSGRAALEANPLLKTTRLHKGLVIEVGNSPYDVFTDEGEALLVEATYSLPPVHYPS